MIDRLVLLVAPLAVAATVLASMIHSWTFDYQPQGRYLFSALVPLALIFGGTALREPRWLQGFRFVIWILLFSLALYVLWGVLLSNPEMYISP